jgi:hypothetical protein
MEVLVIGAVLLGISLGRVFKVLILVPASVLGIVLIAIYYFFVGHSLLGLLLQTAVLITSLQVGYVAGLMSTNLPAVTQGLRKKWTNLLHLTPSRTAHTR